jgi:hypothetical protein
VKDKLKTTKGYQTIGTQTDSNETYHNNIYHSGITYQQVRMLTLLQNRHQLLFWIKKSKNFNSYLQFKLKNFIFSAFGGTKRNKKNKCFM